MTPGSGNTLKHLLALSCFVISITNLTACSQVHGSSDSTRPETPAKSASPVAYVYVSQEPVPGGPNQVLGYSIAASGKLTSIESSPFDADVAMMAVNGKYFLGSSTDGSSVDTYTIEPDGALKYKTSNHIGGLSTFSFYAEPLSLTLAHTGSTLYQTMAGNGNESVYESFTIDKNSGTLSITKGFVDTTGCYRSRLAILANNRFAYDTSPTLEDGCDWGLNSYTRDAYGSLHPVASSTIDIPSEKGQAFNPTLVAADPTNHLAVCLEPIQVDAGPPAGPEQIGVYTADAEGKLTSTSTYKNMPAVLVGEAVAMRTSPSGKLLAVGGTTGLQVFHFNGTNPASSYATLVKNVVITDVRWDNDNHLFALGVNGELFEFMITSSTITQAPGSPSSIPGAQYFIVQPLPL